MRYDSALSLCVIDIAIYIVMHYSTLQFLEYCDAGGSLYKAETSDSTRGINQARIDHSHALLHLNVIHRTRSHQSDLRPRFGFVSLVAPARPAAWWEAEVRERCTVGKCARPARLLAAKGSTLN